jgi:hypothetical protein
MRLIRTSDLPYKSDWLVWEPQGDVTEQILQYAQEHYWVYDADVCGWRDIQFVVRDNGAETFWEVEHAWWIEHDPEWELRNEFDLKQIESVQFEYPTKNRDWLLLIK